MLHLLMLYWLIPFQVETALETPMPMQTVTGEAVPTGHSICCSCFCEFLYFPYRCYFPDLTFRTLRAFLYFYIFNIFSEFSFCFSHACGSYKLLFIFLKSSIPFTHVRHFPYFPYFPYFLNVLDVSLVTQLFTLTSNAEH